MVFTGKNGILNALFEVSKYVQELISCGVVHAWCTFEVEPPKKGALFFCVFFSLSLNNSVKENTARFFPVYTTPPPTPPTSQSIAR